MSLSFLSSQRICLRPLEIEDADLFWKWFSDREVTQYSLTQWVCPTSKLEAREWLEKEIRGSKSISLGIVLTDSGELIGFAGISGINRINSSGEYFILIGEKSYWNQGLGKEVARLVVDYGFKSLNLNRIMLTVSEVNQAGVRSYLKSGFKEEGRLRQACYREGKYHDKIVMSVLRQEWL